MTYNRIPVAFGATKKVTGPTISYQYDVVQKLMIKGLDLPEIFEVDFCNDGDSTTITMPGTVEGGVQIPDDFLKTGKPVKAYIVLTGEDEGAVETRYEITLPVRKRPARTDIQPTPAEQQQIDALIDTLNDAVGSAEASAEESERQAGISEDHALDAEAWAVGERGGDPVESADETYHNNAKYYAGEADRISRDNATLAESWAVGGTGKRQGEDNDNAKHYAEVAQQGAEEAGYAWFDVNDQDGEMYVTITASLEEDVSFLVNEAVGTLEVTYG